uniref:Uncharacterized protein n=1 Tax=Anguilla anguilla TaxID=7936 RepID=A0A0E9SKG6_ANGAN
MRALSVGSGSRLTFLTSC